MAGRRRLVLRTLTEVTTLAQRQHAGASLLRQARDDGNLLLAIDLYAAIYTPTDRHWLPADVVNRRET